MTLNEVFRYLEQNPLPVILYFTALPLLAWVLEGVSAGNQQVVAWRTVYAVLVYGVCIPGIFAVTLNVYLFLFERLSVWEANLLLQILPIVSMVITLMLIKSRISFDLIPGFVGVLLLIRFAWSKLF